MWQYLAAKDPLYPYLSTYLLTQIHTKTPDVDKTPSLHSWGKHTTCHGTAVLARTE